MATMNGVPFRRLMVAESKYRIKCPYLMTPKKLTVHNTDNQMPAENEINYMRNNNTATSYHIAVDESEAIQALPFNRNGFHAGDGANGYGNRNTIGMEICRNYDRGRRTTRLIQPLAGMYDRAERNAIKVAAQLLLDLGIVATVNTVKKHQDWSGKNCPSKILNEARWGAVQAAIIAEYNRLAGKPSVAGARVYVVKRGDSLSGIAKAHKTTVAELVKINGIKNPNIIAIGQKITLPVGGASAPAKPAAPKPAAPARPKANLALDWSWGPEVTKALQRVLGTPVDGIISGQYRTATTRAVFGVRYGKGGSVMIRALQRKLGVAADGLLGPATVRALQRHLGTPVDGIISRPRSSMVLALQKRLNAGTF